MQIVPSGGVDTMRIMVTMPPRERSTPYSEAMNVRLSPAQRRWIEIISDRHDVNFSAALREVLDRDMERFTDRTGMTIRERLERDELEDQRARRTLEQIGRDQALERELDDSRPSLPAAGEDSYDHDRDEPPPF